MVQCSTNAQQSTITEASMLERGGSVTLFKGLATSVRVLSPSATLEEARQLKGNALHKVLTSVGLVNDYTIRDDSRINDELRFANPRVWVSLLCAACLWTVLGVFVSSFVLYAASNEEPDRSVDEWAWDAVARTLPEIHVLTPLRNVTIEVKNCVIANGNLSARDLHPNKIHPIEGGCESGLHEEIPVRAKLDVEKNACSASATDDSMNHCFRLLPTKVVGHFGSKEYRYTTIEIWVPDPASDDDLNRTSGNKLEDLMEASRKFFRRREEECDFVVRIADLDKKHLSVDGGSTDMSYFNLYNTMTLDMQLKKEVFFQYKTKKTFGNSDLGLSVLFRPFRRALYGKLHEGGVDSDWTAYHNEWTRFSKPRASDRKLQCAKVFMRASSDRLQIIQVPHLTWLQIPQEAGGFFTGLILFLAFIVKTCLWSSGCGKCCKDNVRTGPNEWRVGWRDERQSEVNIEPSEQQGTFAL